MAKKPSKKKVVVTTSKSNDSSRQSARVSPTISRARGTSTTNVSTEPLLFDRQNYIFMAAGAVLIAIGLMLMAGGSMTDPNEWKPDVIYSFRRTALAPVVILAGLAIEIYAIFKR